MVRRRPQRKVTIQSPPKYQFSYASSQKNYDAVEFRREEEARVLRDVKVQIDVLKTRYVIPFASFRWFCTEDNFYLNEDKNQIRDVARFISEPTQAEAIGECAAKFTTLKLR